MALSVKLEKKNNENGHNSSSVLHQPSWLHGIEVPSNSTDYPHASMIDFSVYRNAEVHHHQNDNPGLFDFLPQQKSQTDPLSCGNLDRGDNYFLFAENNNPHTPKRLPRNHVDSGFFEHSSYNDLFSSPQPWTPCDKFSKFDSIVSEIVDEDNNCSLFSFDGSLDDSFQRDGYASNDRSFNLPNTSWSAGADQATTTQNQFMFDLGGQMHSTPRSNCWPKGERSASGKGAVEASHNVEIFKQSQDGIFYNSIPSSDTTNQGENTKSVSYSTDCSSLGYQSTQSTNQPGPSNNNHRLSTGDQSTQESQLYQYGGTNQNALGIENVTCKNSSNNSYPVSNTRRLLDFNGNRSANNSCNFDAFLPGTGEKCVADNTNVGNFYVQNITPANSSMEPQGISGNQWPFNQSGPSTNPSGASNQTIEQQNLNDKYYEQNSVKGTTSFKAKNQVSQGMYTGVNLTGSGHGSGQSIDISPAMFPAGTDNLGNHARMINQNTGNIVTNNQRSGTNQLNNDGSNHLNRQILGNVKHINGQSGGRVGNQLLGSPASMSPSENGHIAGNRSSNYNQSNRLGQSNSVVKNQLTRNNQSTSVANHLSAINHSAANMLPTGQNHTPGLARPALGTSNQPVSPEDVLQCLSKLPTSLANSILQQHYSNPKLGGQHGTNLMSTQDKQHTYRNKGGIDSGVPQGHRSGKMGTYTDRQGITKNIQSLLQQAEKLSNHHLHKEMNPQELYSAMTHLNHPFLKLPTPGLLPGHVLAGHPGTGLPAEFFEYYPLDPYAPFAPAYLPPEMIYDMPAYYGLPPFMQGFRAPRRSGPSNELHMKLEECYDQFRNIERERKKTEAELARQHPGKKISSTNNIVVPRLPSNPSRVDRLVVDSFKEHARIITLIEKMEKLMGASLHPNIHSAIERWLEGIRKVQARRKEEIVNATNRNRNGGPRHQDEKDVLALAASIEELTTLARRARTVTWCALQISDKDNPTLCKLGIDIRVPSLPQHFQQSCKPSTAIPITAESASESTGSAAVKEKVEQN